MQELALDLNRQGYRGAVADSLYREDPVAVDAHAVGGLMRLGPPAHQADRHTGRPTLAVLEVVHIAQSERSGLAGIVEMPEIRLAIQEQHRRHALRADERQRADFDVAGHEDAKERRQRDPAERPAQPDPGDAHTVALGVV